MIEAVHALSVGSRASRLALRLAVALFVTFGISLAASQQAQAAECGTSRACFDAAVWQREIARDYFNKGVWFREHSKQHFGQAYEWNQRATFAFHAGDATAAAWYKAIADDYSRKAVDNAKAADDYFARAAFTHAAYMGSLRRGSTLLAAEARRDVDEESGLTTAAAGAGCKWDGKPGPGGLRNTFDESWFKAEVVSNWCYNGTSVTNHRSVPGGEVTFPVGVLQGWFFVETHWAYSKCHTFNGVSKHNCLTKREFNLLNGHTGDTASICIGTRIYGGGGHHRNIIEHGWDACGDGKQPWWT